MLHIPYADFRIVFSCQALNQRAKALHVISSVILKHLSFRNEIYMCPQSADYNSYRCLRHSQVSSYSTVRILNTRKHNKYSLLRKYNTKLVMQACISVSKMVDSYWVQVVRYNERGWLIYASSIHFILLHVHQQEQLP